MADEMNRDQFRDQIRTDVIKAFGAAGEEAAADEEYARAVRKRDELEAAYAAALPARMREVAGVLNVRFAAILPDGIRLEWPAQDEESDR